MNGQGVTAEQRSLLRSNTYSLKPLSSAGNLNIWQVVVQTLAPIVVFLFSLGILTVTPRFTNETLVLVIYGVVLAGLMIYPTIAFVLLLIGVAATRIKSKVKWSPVIYWSWWPFFKFVLIGLAAYAGGTIGNYIWYNELFPYQMMSRLQAYGSVNPTEASGTRLQDAGVVLFNTSVGVDRTKTGCLKDGATYCVAPILDGGVVLPNTPTGVTYDLFMAGMDCCTCPGEFRCGAWNQPAPYLGGLRITNAVDRQYYRLAAEQWGSTYGKPVEQAIFFHWVADPVSEWHEFRQRGLRIGLLAAFVVPFGLIMINFILNGLLGILHDKGYAAPLEAPLPPPGMGRGMSARYLPQMHAHNANAEAQQYGSGEPNFVVL